MKKLITVLLIITTSLMSATLNIIADNNGSIAFKKERFFVSRIFDEDILKKLNIQEIKILNEDKTREYKIKERLPSKKRIKVSNNGLLDILDRIVVNKYDKEDILIIISSMGFTDRKTNISSYGKEYNDAWITSSKSPLKRFLDKYPNKPLDKVKVFILDPNHNLKYLQNRERFFVYFFNKLGANLYYYGSLDGDYNRLIDYTKSNKTTFNIEDYKPLSNETYLMLDNDILQYELE